MKAEKTLPRLKFTIITLFIDSVKAYLDSSMMRKAQEHGIIEVDYVNLRDFGIGPHRSVDDTPYGGGDGMLLRCEPVFAAVESVLEKEKARQMAGMKKVGQCTEGGASDILRGEAQFLRPEVILPTPVGKTWSQVLAREMAGVAGHGIINDISENETGETAANSQVIETTPKHYIILCPHYEGYDERILSLVDHKISLGKYVLTGGELPALIMIDSMVRLLPGVLGGEKSAEIESFSDGDNLEYPQYTKPAEFRGMKVPEVLLSGHHGKVDEWRKRHSGTAENML